MVSVYTNHLRLEEIGTGEQSGDWGATTNTNLELIAEGFSYGTEAIGDANTTITMADGASDGARSLYLKITSSTNLTATRTITLAPNTVSKVWIIENATSGSQIITIKQGTGATVNIANGQVKMIATDGGGTGGIVYDLLTDVELAGTTTATALTVDDVAIDGKVITMTGSSGDTATMTVGANGVLAITTTDGTGTSANITITADGTFEAVGTTVTLNSSGGITLDADGGTITFADDGSSLGTITSSGYSGTAAVATTVTITDNESTNEDNAIIFTAGGDVDGGNLGLESDGNLTYNPSTGRLTATQLAGELQTGIQGNISSLGTLSSLTVDQVVIDGAVIGHTSDTDLITLSSGVVAVAGEITGTGFTGTLDGILGSGTAAAATVTTLDTSGAVNLNLVTDSTSSTSGALIVDGGVGIAKKLFVGTDLSVGGNLTIPDDGLFAATNTAGNILVADGTNFNSIAVSSLSEISTAANDDVLIAIDTSGGGLKKISRSAIIAGTGSSSDLANVVEDTTPQLGGNLDVVTHSIITDTGNRDINFQAHGTGVVEIKGNTDNSGENEGAIKLMCHANTHGQTLKAQPHSESITNTMLLPKGSSSTLVSLISTDTLQNKTFLDLATIKDTTNDANGAILQFVKDKGAAAADGDAVGTILFTGDNSAQEQTNFASIVAEVSESADTDEAGKLSFFVAESNGTSSQLTAGLILEGEHNQDGQVDVTIGAGSGSTTIIAGDLQVSGTTTTVNSTTVNLNDHNIVLDSGNSTSAVVNGAGITIEGGGGDDATFTYNTTGPKFELKLGSSHEDLQVDGLIAGSLDISGAADIAGDLTLSAGADGALTFSVASSVKIKDDEGASLVFEEANNAYMTFVTTNSSEAIKFDKALDINAAVQLDSTFTVGENDTGYDVKFFGASASHFMLWDESADELVLAADSKLSFNDAAGGENIVASSDGHLEVNAGTTLDVTAPTVQLNASTAVDINGALTQDGGAVFNEDSADVDFRVESNGNANMLVVNGGDNSVGVGIATPTRSPFHVHMTTDDTDSNIHLTSNETGSGSGDGFTLGVSAGGANDLHTYMIQRENADIKMYTNGTEHLKITNGGKVEVLVGGIDVEGGAVFNEDSADVDFRVESNGNTHALFVDGGNNRVGILNSSPSVALDVTGAIVASDNVTAFSDERLKDNIVTIPEALAKVEAMRGVHYTKDSKAGSGVIAQELEKVAPELVENATEYKSVAYGNITGYLIEAVKELSAKVKELEARLD